MGVYWQVKSEDDEGKQALRDGYIGDFGGKSNLDGNVSSYIMHCLTTAFISKSFVIARKTKIQQPPNDGKSSSIFPHRKQGEGSTGLRNDKKR